MRREYVVDALALIAAKTAVSLAVLAIGFTHVSDDDYARTVIAQTFAHAPKLDPSGTSWLPFPFWVTGWIMAVFGRSLETARASAIMMSSLAAVAPYFGARSLGASRQAALIGALVASCTPVCAWLGAATVPEGFSGLLTAGAVLVIASRRAPIPAALALLAAALSRYESWPACAIAAVALVLRRDRRSLQAAGLCVLGPLGWMVWNKLAHGSFTHFFSRVSTFRDIHVGAVPMTARIFGNAVALATSYPEALVLFGIAAVSLRIERRWWLPLLCALGTLVFLTAGDIRGGAPTHHAERALVPIAACLVLFGVACAPKWLPRPVIPAVFIVVTCLRIRDYPGASKAEDRSEQIARGRELRSAQALDVTPCAYEHFALIAAYGRPESVTIRAAGPTLPAPDEALCPVATQR